MDDSVRTIHAYLRVALDGPGAERVGPFLAGFSDMSANPFRNYAVPDDGAEPSPDDIAVLVAAFTRRDRVPRLEYVPSLAPAVESALLGAGFAVEGRLPVLTLATAAVVDAIPPAGVIVGLATGDDQLLAVATVQHRAYDDPEPPGAAAVAGLRRTVEGGGVVALARDAATGEPLGAGLCAEPHGGVSELAAVGVETGARNRGIAAAVVAHLVGAAAQAGIDRLFLMAAHDQGARIYRRAGFADVATILHISKRPARP